MKNFRIKGRSPFVQGSMKQPCMLRLDSNGAEALNSSFNF